MQELYCKKCEKFWKFGNNSGHGVCSLPESFFPTHADNACHYVIKPKKICGMCGHFYNDTACLWHEKDDEACIAFVDKLDDDLMNILFTWFTRGEYSRERVEELCSQLEDSPEYKFVLRYKEKQEEK